MSVLVIGEVLVDVIWRKGQGQMTPRPGGSPANVALGLHRLGHQVTLMTCWGDDPPGDMLREHLVASGVTVHRVPGASGRTTIALAYVDQDAGTASYDFLPAWDPGPLPLDPSVTLLHTGSLAGVLEPGASRVLQACRHVRGTQAGAVTIDLNVRPAAMPRRDAYRAAAESLTRHAHVVKASDEDLRWLYPGQDPAEAARGLLALGPQLAIVTRGQHGATAITGAHQIDAPAPAVDIADTIGAGDAFQAALLDALLGYGRNPGGQPRIPATRAELSTLLGHCTAAGAVACTRPGAQPPTRDEIRALGATAAL